MFNSEIRENFRDVWSEYDQDATSYIKKDKFTDFMFRLPQPLGWDETFQNNEEKQKEFISKLNLSLYKKKSSFYFIEVLETLALFYVVSQEITRYIKE